MKYSVKKGARKKDTGDLQKISHKLPAINKKNSNAVLRQGYVEKKTDGIIFQWHRRYMVLTSEKIFFFPDQIKTNVIGCINLKLITTRLEEDGDQLVLDFLGECDNLILKFENYKDKEEWKVWLEHVISYHSKEIKLVMKTIAKPFYQDKDFITEK